MPKDTKRELAGGVRCLATRERIWIVLQALRAAVRQVDTRGPLSSLNAALPSPWQQQDPRQWPVLAQALDREQIAAMFPRVAAAADVGDSVAAEILSDALDHLTQLVLAVARQLDAIDAIDRLVLTGGVLLHRPTWPTALISRLAQQGVRVGQVERIDDPARGAVEIAYREASR